MLSSRSDDEVGGITARSRAKRAEQSTARPRAAELRWSDGRCFRPGARTKTPAFGEHRRERGEPSHREQSEPSNQYCQLWQD